jgi:hypothetical protein
MRFGDEKASVKCIMKVDHNFKQATVEPNILRIFQALEFEFELLTPEVIHIDFVP